MKTKITLLIMVLALVGYSSFVNAQAAQLKELAPGNTSSTPEQFTVVNNTAYFITIINFRRALWKTDGTAAGTVMLKDSIITTPESGRFVIRGHVNDTLYYTVNTSGQSDTTTEIWITTGGAPELLTTVTSSRLGGISSGEPRQYAFAGGKMYFQMFTEQYGYELWVCDGTAAGTKMVIDLCPGSNGSFAAEGAQDARMVEYKGKIYFRGNTTPIGGELYASDGTAGGTVPVKPTMQNDADPDNLMVFNNELYYTADDGGQEGLWKTDGTAAGTVFIGAYGFNNGFVFNNNLYFPVAGTLWKTDGTTGGTAIVKDSVGLVIGANNGYFYTSYMKSLPVAPYYTMYYWKSDGTTAGTVRVSDSVGMGASFQVLNNKMYGAPMGNTLWETDGTDAGTKRIIDGIINYPTVVNNTVLFSNWGTGSGYELWSFAPTVTGIAEPKAANTALTVYPNPSTGIFTINLSNSQNSTLQVFNLLGEQVLQQADLTEINLSTHPQGMYIVKVTEGAKTYSARIVRN